MTMSKRAKGRVTEQGTKRTVIKATTLNSYDIWVAANKELQKYREVIARAFLAAFQPLFTSERVRLEPSGNTEFRVVGMSLDQFLLEGERFLASKASKRNR